MSRYVIDTTTTSTFIPSSYDSVNSVVHDAGGTKKGCKNTEGTANYAIFYLVTGANADTWVYYDFDCSNIPQDAVINEVSCRFRAGAYSTTTGIMNSNYGQLAVGTDLVGTSAGTFNTDINTIRNVSVGIYQFTREDLDNVKLCLHARRGTNSSYTGSTSVNFKFYGAELNVNYSVGHYEYEITLSTLTSAVTTAQTVYYVLSGASQNVDVQISNISNVIAEDNYVNITSSLTLVTGTTYRYALTNINEDHNIVFDDSTIDLPDEDPNYNYHTISISSINVDTTPSNGSFRVQEGVTQDVIINPTEEVLAIARDNGVDISSQIVPYQNIKNVSYVVNSHGAPHTFSLNEDGWYESATISITTTNTTALSRITFDLDVACIITIQYYGQPASANDYIKISNLDLTLSTGSTDTSANVRINTSSSSYTQSNPANVIYNDVPEGQHTIDFKLRRGSSTSSAVSHKAYFKVLITPLEPITNYKYTISNIQESHSIIFVYGNVNYHILTSETNSNAKLLPYGDWALIDGENYKLTIVPDSDYDSVSVTDNNVDVTQYVERRESVNNGITSVNYIYKLYNVSTNHDIAVTVSSGNNNAYVKSGAVWKTISKTFIKENNSWTEVSDILDVIDNSKIYILGN